MQRRAHPAKRALAMAGVIAVTVAGAGCGNKADYANNDRPPTPVVVAAVIAKARVSVSPHSIGAGPISLIATNQTDVSQELTLESTNTSGATVNQSTGPINPQDTASLKVTLAPGTYRVHVRDPDIRPARLIVGPERPSAQNEVLQP